MSVEPHKVLRFPVVQRVPDIDLTPGVWVESTESGFFEPELVEVQIDQRDQQEDNFFDGLYYFLIPLAGLGFVVFGFVLYYISSR